MRYGGFGIAPIRRAQLYHFQRRFQPRLLHSRYVHVHRGFLRDESVSRIPSCRVVFFVDDPQSRAVSYHLDRRRELPQERLLSIPIQPRSRRFRRVEQ